MSPKNIISLTTKIKNQRFSFSKEKMSRLKQYWAMLAFFFFPTDVITTVNERKILFLENIYFHSKGQVTFRTWMVQ